MNERFWNKVKKSENCWNWNASKLKNGYGQFRLNGKMVKSHRLSWEINNGEIPDGMFVLHHCDNPACVRPDHLFLGTQQDNIDDMKRKGRQAKGEKHGMFGRTGAKAPMFRKGHLVLGEKNPHSKITKQDVLDIRLLNKETNFSQTEIGKIFGISGSNVNYIVNRKIWKHV